MYALTTEDASGRLTFPQMARVEPQLTELVAAIERYGRGEPLPDQFAWHGLLQGLECCVGPDSDHDGWLGSREALIIASDHLQNLLARAERSLAVRRAARLRRALS